MRLLDLQIENVRGICGLPLKPDGKNVVIWGPNGCGKSGVVDALDFLLGGRISRLTGTGTDGISLEKHGPHIDHKPKDATVKAKLLIPGISEPVEIARNMAHPNVVECDDSVRHEVMRVLAIAQRGQYILTRRDLLSYVTAPAGERGERVQQLLNISEVEETRRALVNVKNQLGNEHALAQSTVNGAYGNAAATVGLPVYDRAEVLKSANKLRAVLGGEPLDDLTAAILKTGLNPPTTQKLPEQAIDRQSTERTIASLRAAAEPGDRGEGIAKAHHDLRTLLDQIKSQPHILRDLSLLQLIEMGINLIDDSGACPLCEQPWPQGALRQQLEERLTKAQLAAEQQNTIQDLCNSIANPANAVAASIRNLLVAAGKIGMDQESASLSDWLTDIETLLEALDSPLEKYLNLSHEDAQIAQMLASARALGTLQLIERRIEESCQETPPELSAWDTLTTLESNMSAVKAAEKRLSEATQAANKAGVLLECFEEARNEVLSSLYDKIRERFVHLYRQLHSSDEGDFAATLEAEGAGLNFEVDFYGRGEHPPHALHSEGHQDSMGLCLYLALTEQLTKGHIDLIVLDDVVMSVDEGHRREVCRVLASEFPERQFLITTHDRDWAFLLNSEGVVTQRNLLQFFGWNVETGPKWDDNLDTWAHIEQHLGRNDVPDAAAVLRRSSEQFFTLACQSLMARVVCKPQAFLDLGDVLHPAVEQYGELLKLAKKAANSWNNKEEIARLAELETYAAGVKSRSNVESWQVNPSVHYNSWHSLATADFRPVVKAFQELWNLFRCAKCGGMLYVFMTSDRIPVEVRCNCEATSWNLRMK